MATHGLRDRIRRSQEATARLQERVGELMVVQDRDRLAADLQSTVVQRVFAAGLSLQSILAMVTKPEVRRRVEASVAGRGRDQAGLERAPAGGLGRRSPARPANDPDQRA